MSRAIVVVPTYNEAATVDELLDRVLASHPAVEVLVVDDSSPDGTGARVRAHDGAVAGRVHLLEREGKSGLAAAYRAGFTWALRSGYDEIAQMDADLSHPPEELPALLGALGQAEVAVGSRYVPGGGIAAWTWLRRLISLWGNVFVRTVLGLTVRDATAGFKAFRRDALVHIGATASTSNGYCFQVENAWRAERLGLRVTEIPITFTDRTQGSSKMSSRIVVEALLRVVFWRAAELARRWMPETVTFLAVGGAGYVTDVVAFNLLRTLDPFALLDPTVARTLAVIPAMAVTFIGHRSLTWQDRERVMSGRERRAQFVQFVVVNAFGFGISVGCLAISHDALGWRSAVADNISANVVGLALGTVFRFAAYRWFVFGGSRAEDHLPAFPVPVQEGAEAS